MLIICVLYRHRRYALTALTYINKIKNFGNIPKTRNPIHIATRRRCCRRDQKKVGMKL